jgi:alpha-ketoglutarate-dependent taurine dioxygenase
MEVTRSDAGVHSISSTKEDGHCQECLNTGAGVANLTTRQLLATLLRTWTMRVFKEMSTSVRHYATHLFALIVGVTVIVANVYEA